MSFWTSGSGLTPLGKPEDAFVKEFSIIPNNTTALARIKSFINVFKDNQYTGVREHYLLIDWKIESGEFKGREVTQKIKCFDGKPEQIDRNLNMLRLIMNLCGFQPTHSDAPSDHDLKHMLGKICGIKIREWSIEKKDGSGFAEGNFVAEVHSASGFEVVVGVKKENPVMMSIDSALSRNSSRSMNLVEDDLPF